MPPPTELVNGRWQVIGSGRAAVVSAPRRIARHSARATGPVAAGAAIGGAGTVACYAAGWPAGLFGPDGSAAGANGQGAPAAGGGATPGALAGWPGGLPDLSPGFGGGMLAPGSVPFTGPVSGPGANTGGGGEGSPARPGEPIVGPGQPPTGPGGEETIPSGPGGPGGPDQPVAVPEPQAVAVFLGFLVLFGAVIWMKRRRVAQPLASRSASRPSRHTRRGSAATA